MTDSDLEALAEKIEKTVLNLIAFDPDVNGADRSAWVGQGAEEAPFSSLFAQLQSPECLDNPPFRQMIAKLLRDVGVPEEMVSTADNERLLQLARAVVAALAQNEGAEDDSYSGSSGEGHEAEEVEDDEEEAPEADQ